jgi:hypothetical protein
LRRCWSGAIEARNQTSGAGSYTFSSWSDGGAQQHSIVVPSPPELRRNAYEHLDPLNTVCVQVNSARPQSNQSQVTVMFNGAQTA